MGYNLDVTLFYMIRGDNERVSFPANYYAVRALF